MSKNKAPATVPVEHDYDTVEGVRAALQAAKKGDAVAAETLARRLSWIIGGDVPYSDAEVNELISVAEAGWNSILSHPECHPEDMYQYAVDILWDDEGNLIVENAGDGAAWMLRAAEGDHADAQLEVGRFYYEGVGLKQSLEHAAEWLKKAAKDELNAEHAHYFLSEIKKKSGKAPTKKPVAKKAASAGTKKPVTKKAPAKKGGKDVAKKPVAKKAKVVAKATKAPAKPVKAVAKKSKPASKASVVKAKPVAKKVAKPAKKKAPAKRK